jgi:hypothetical protein
LDKKRNEKGKILKDLEEKIKIDAEAGQSPVEHRFLPERSPGLFFLSNISVYYLS